jgi:HEAT repeat protein
MAETGQADHERVGALLDRLEKDGGDRDAALALWGLGPESAGAVPVLIARLQREDSAVRGLAARILGQVGKGSAAAAAALTAALRDEAPELRTAATVALGEVGLGSDEVRGLLTAAIESGDELRRVLAARSMLLLWPEEAGALELLREAHQSQLYEVRSWAASALVALAPAIPEAIGHAIEFLDDWESATVEDTARGLARRPAEAVLPLLLRALRRPDPALRRGALTAIEAFQGGARPFAAQIEAALLETGAFDDGSRDVRRLAANVARAVLLDSPAVVARLARLLEGGDEWVCEQAALALLSFKGLPAGLRAQAEAALERLR